MCLVRCDMPLTLACLFQGRSSINFDKNDGVSTSCFMRQGLLISRRRIGLMGSGRRRGGGGGGVVRGWR